jgi:hypothetical protein
VACSGTALLYEVEGRELVNNLCIDGKQHENESQINRLLIYKVYWSGLGQSYGRHKQWSYRSSHQIICFKVTEKSYKASNAVLLPWSRAVREVKSLRGLEACNLVTASIVTYLIRKFVAQGSGSCPMTDLYIGSVEPSDSDFAVLSANRAKWVSSQYDVYDDNFSSIITVKMVVLWVVAPCILVVYWRFRSTCCLHHQDDDGGSKHLWNVRKLLSDYTAHQPRVQPSSYWPPWEPEISQYNNGVSIGVSIGLYCRISWEGDYVWWVGLHKQLAWNKRSIKVLRG